MSRETNVAMVYTLEHQFATEDAGLYEALLD